MLHKIPINIANILLELNGPLSASELGIEEHLKPYFGRPQNSAARVSLCWEESINVPVPRGKMIYDPGSILKIYHDAPDYYAELSDNTETKTPPVPAVLRANPEWDDLLLVEQRTGHGWKSLLDTYAGELIVRTVIINTGGLFFHASCLDDNGRGLIFIGHSGVGKSTQLALWSKKPGVIAVNDDRIAVRAGENGPTCYGIPWSGSTDISCNHKAPLKAIIILEKALSNDLKLLSPSAASPVLAACAFLPYWERSLMMRALANIDKILKLVPVYRLRCRPEKEVIPLVRSVL